MKQVCTILAVLSFHVPLAHPGAWTQKKGHFYSKISVHRFESNSQFLLSGHRQPLSDNGRVLDVSLYYYLEYGLFEDLTFVTSIPLRVINFSCAIESCDATSAGLGDTVFGLRYRLAQKNWVVSLQTGVKIAPGYETDEARLNSKPPLGDGQTDFDFRVLLGRSIFGYRGYVNFDLGYRARSGKPVDEITYSSEFGMNLSSHYTLVGRIYGVRGISESQSQRDFRIVDGRVQNFVGTGALEDFLKAQLQLIYKISARVELSFLFEQILDGRNTSQASILGGGIAIHR